MWMKRNDFTTIEKKQNKFIKKWIQKSHTCPMKKTKQNKNRDWIEFNEKKITKINKMDKNLFIHKCENGKCKFKKNKCFNSTENITFIHPNFMHSTEKDKESER